MAQTKTGPIDIAAVIDRSRLGRFQLQTIFLCGLVMVLDGFDLQAIGYVAPAIMQEWQVDRAALGVLFGAGLIGMMIGSLIFGVLADKIGRRPVLIGSTIFFGLAMLATSQAGSIEELRWLRLITGIGIGGIMPNGMALAGEYSPARRRILVMMLVSCGFTLGAALGGLLAAWLTPALGWRSVFVFGGVMPLIVALLMIVALPESMQLLLANGRPTARFAQWLKRIDPSLGIDANTAYARPEKAAVMPVAELFRDGRTLTTLLLFIVCFMNLLDLYFLSNWIPTVLTEAKFPMTYAVLAGTALQVGGTVGTVLLGWLIDRYGFGRVLVSCFLVAAVGIAAMGRPVSPTLLIVVIAIVGFCIVGGQPAVNALTATRYPTALRATAIGWSLGVGRIGSIVGPMAGGVLLQWQWPVSSVFMLVAIPALVSAVLVAILTSRTKGATSLSGALVGH